jgi:pyrroloquinoline quinone biosynthesis protein D
MMTAGATADPDSRPHLAPHVQFRFDARRDRWIVLAPERLLIPDEVAVEVLRRCTGSATFAEIVDDLSKSFAAPREEIARDVAGLVHELSEKRILVW